MYESSASKRSKRLLTVSAKGTYERIVDSDDPEAEAEKMFEEFFESIEDDERRTRMKARHWRIQQELNKAKDPVQRYNKMVEMFWKGFLDFKSIMDETKDKLQ